MAVLNRQITTVPSTSAVAVLSAPTSPSVRGLLSLVIHSPAANSSIVATISFYDGTTNYPIDVQTIAGGGSYRISDKMLLTSTDEIRVTLGTGPTTPFNVIASYNDGQ